MTTLPYSYTSAAFLNAKPLHQQEIAPVAAPAVAPEAAQFTRAAIDNLRQQFGALDQNVQADMLETMRFNGVCGEQAVAAFLDRSFCAAPVIGNDPMLATATSQGMHNLNAVHNLQQENGYTTNLDPNHQAILRSQIENLIKGMGKAEVEDIVRAARGITNSPEAAAFAEQTVREIKAPEQFALMNGAELANVPVATLAAVASVETANPLNPREQDWLSNLIKPDFAKREEDERNKYRTQAGPTPSVGMQAAMEALSSGNEMLGNLTVDANLPKLAGGRGRGGPDFA